MDAHEIRLRGGWESAAPDDSPSGKARLTLPARLESLPAGRVRLVRRFNRPPRIECGAVVLRVSQAPGIRSVLLNGRRMGPISPERPDFDLELGSLAPRNELVIEADPPGGGPAWGVVSLIFQEW